ncbi:hypothetical protein ACMFMG_005925 [Clarireedia jacksonii]
MPTTIHLVRHAQGFHNLCPANHQMHDPLLTDLGLEQCRTLSQTFPHNSLITHLVASPLRRTIYTTLHSFPSVLARGTKVIALPEIQETSDLPCDTGSDKAVLEEEFSKGEFKGMVDLGLVGEGWNVKTGKYEASSKASDGRAREARVWLRDLGRGKEDVHVVVVTHGGFLHYFTEDWEDSSKFLGTGWANIEFRSYQFVDEKGDDANASIKETRESRESRMGTEKELTREEQENLRRVTQGRWFGDGFAA